MPSSKERENDWSWSHSRISHLLFLKDRCEVYKVQAKKGTGREVLKGKRDLNLSFTDIFSKYFHPSIFFYMLKHSPEYDRAWLLVPIFPLQKKIDSTNDNQRFLFIFILDFMKRGIIWNSGRR